MLLAYLTLTCLWAIVIAAASPVTLTQLASFTVSSPVDFDTCNLASYITSSSALSGTYYSRVYSSSFPRSDSALIDASPAIAGGLGAVKLLSYSNGATIVYSNNASSSGYFLDIRLLGSSVRASLSMPNKVNALLLDPDFPLLYFAGVDVVGVLNVSNPMAPVLSKLWTASVQNTLLVTGPTGLAVNGTTLYVANSAQRSSLLGSVVCFDLSSSSNQLRASRNFGHTMPNLKVETIRFDPYGRYIAATRIGGISSLYLIQQSVPNTLLNNVSNFGAVSDLIFFQSFILLASTSSPRYFIANASTLASISSSVSGFSANNPASSLRWRNGSIWAATTSDNVVQSLNLSGIDTQQADEKLDACNRTPIDGSNLYLTSRVPLIADAQNIRPIARSQLLVSSSNGRYLRWNNVTYTVGASSASGDHFEVFSNSSASWSFATTFNQNDVDDGLVRFVPAANYLSQCQSGLNSTAYTGSLTVSATDVWSRTLTNAKLPYAVLCCPNKTQTSWNTVTVEALAFDPKLTPIASCSVPMPGYFLNSATGSASACPIGTFKTSVGVGSAQDTCASCPDGYTTGTVASVSFSSCQNATAYIAGPWSLSTLSTNAGYSYSVPQTNLIPNGIPTSKPLFVVASVRASQNFVVGFSSSVPSNGSAPSASIVRVVFGNSSGQLSQISDTDSTTTAAVSSNWVSSEFFVTIWAYYYEGFAAAGVVPFGVDLKTDASYLRRQLLQNLLAKKMGSLPVGAFNGLYQQFSNRSIASVVFGGLGWMNATVSDIWSAQVSDALTDYDVQLNETIYSYTFLSTNVESMLYSILPKMTVTWTLNGSAVYWINSADSVFDFSVDTDYIGKIFDMYNSNGLTDPKLWTLTTLASSLDLSLGRIFLKARSSQAFLLSLGSIVIRFRALHPAIRVPTSVTRGLLVNLAVVPEGTKLQVSSWNATNRIPSRTFYPSYNSLKIFDDSSNPGLRYYYASVGVGRRIYIYGGQSLYPNGTTYYPDDVWVYDIDLGMFACLIAPRNQGQSSVLPSSLGVEDPSNTPGSLQAGTSAIEGDYLYLFGSTYSAYKCDLWRLNLVTLLWIRVKESTTCSFASGTPSSFSQITGVQNSIVCVFDATAQNAVYVIDASILNGAWMLVNRFSPVNSAYDIYSNGVNYRSSLSFLGVTMLNSTIYAFGGGNNNYASNSLFTFDISTLNSTALLVNQSEPGNTVEYYRKNLPSMFSAMRAGVAVDPFGNILVYGGFKNTPQSSFHSNAVMFYDSSIGKVQWLAGNVSDFTSSSVITALRVPYYDNSPSTIVATGSALLSKFSSDSRYYRLAVISSDGTRGTLVYEMEVYLVKKSPEVRNQTYVANVWPTRCFNLNSSALNVFAYEANPSSILLKLLDTSLVSAMNVSTAASVTQFTYADVIAGSNVKLCIGASPSVGQEIRVPLNVTANNFTVTSYISIKVDCIGVNVDRMSCSCTFGSYLSAGICSLCPQNQYKNSIGASGCVSCPNGSSTGGKVGGTSTTSCSALQGWYRVNDTTFLCDIGYEAISGSCVACSVNYFKGQVGNSPCTSCPTGTSTLGNVGSASCALSEGTYQVNETYYQCNYGTYYNSSANLCLLCPADTYRDTIGTQSNCISCPTGSSTESLLGSVSVRNCTTKSGFILVDPMGFEYGCPAGSTVDGSLEYCISCPADTYKSDVSLGACVTCPPGATTFNRTGFSNCLSTSTYAVVDGYVTCAGGYTSDGVGCVACATNTYKSSAGNGTCTSCPDGYVTSSTASNSSSSCVLLQSQQQVSANSSAPVNIGVVIGAAVGGLAVLALAALFLAYRVSKSKRRVQERRKISKAVFTSSTPESPGLNLTSALSKIGKPYDRVAGNANNATLNMTSQLLTSTGSNPNLYSKRTVTFTRTFNAGTKTAFAPDQIAMAFPGFLLIESSSGYKIGELIAEGGFAKLYVGDLLDVSILSKQGKTTEGVSPSVKCAIKVFKLPIDATPEMLEDQKDDLENEATVMYALACLPNIAKLYAVAETPERALIMKLYDGSLTTLIHGSICPIRDLALAACNNSWILLAARMSVDVINGISCMHVMQISHLDIKPPNMLIEIVPDHEVEGRFPIKAVVADFGLARFNNDLLACKRISRRLTTGLSLPYASPEAFSVVRMLGNNLPVSRNAFIAMDSYSTAVTLWEIFARKKPLLDVPLLEIEAALLQGKKPDLRDLPTPQGSYEESILKLLKEFMQDGMSSRVDNRLTVQEMLDLLKEDESFSEI